MAKTEVYSWRLSAATKEALERQARQQGVSLAELLDGITAAWLDERRRLTGDDEREQAKARKAAAAAIGSLAGGDPRRAESSRATLRKKLAGKRRAS